MRAQYVQIMQDNADLQILVPQSNLYLGFNLVIAAFVAVLCVVIWLTYVSLQVLKENGYSALL